MALESCEILIKTIGGYFHKSKGFGFVGFTDGWRYENLHDVILCQDFRFPFSFLDDRNPVYLMPSQLLTFNTETETE